MIIQLSTIVANAQCDVTLNVNVSDATCASNGQLVVTVEGPDASYIDVATAQYKIESVIPGGYSTPFAVWPNATYNQAPPGEYILTMDAYCNRNGYPQEVLVSNPSVKVGGSYSPLVVSAGVRRKTLNCFISGQIEVSHTRGREPYSITITSKPNEYTGETVFTDLTGTSTILEDFPVGVYNITVADDCEYSTNLTVTMTTVSVDVYSGYFFGLWANGNDCKTVAFGVSSPGSTHELRYYYNNKETADKYYEGRLRLISNNADTTVLKDWTSIYDITRVTMPYDYHQMRLNKDRIFAEIRVKDDDLSACSSYKYVSGTFSLPYFAKFTLTNDCDSTIISFGMDSGVGGDDRTCYPADWQIIDTVTKVVWASGTLLNGNVIFPEQKLAQGRNYVLTLTDASGEVINRYFKTESISGQVFTSTNGYSNGYNSSSTSYNYPNIFGKTYMRIQIAGTENISSYAGPFIQPGTKIEYISAPVGAPDSKFGPVGSSYIIPPGFNSQYFYMFGPGTNHYQYSSTVSESNFEKMVPGEYKFRVTNVCGKDTIYTYTQNAVLNSTNFTYTIVDQSCEGGMEIKPSGNITSTNAAGVVSNVPTYYRILSSTATGYPTDVISEGGTLVLPYSGSYLISMSGVSSNASNYSADTIRVNYENELALDANYTSAYVCRNGSGSFIKVRAKNGVGPYTYTLPATGESNTTGEFNYGAAGEAVIINIEDACGGTSFPATVTMLDLATSIIVYPSTVTVCSGGTIGLNCITLGETTYSWRGPDNFTSTEQYPRIQNATSAMNGYYVVTVTPEGCSDVVSDSILVTVIDPLLPTVSNPSIEFCLNMPSAPSLEVASGAESNDGYSLKWYRTATSTVTITPPSSISTTTPGVTTYYVAQRHNITGCESERVQVLVTITNTPCSYTVSGTVFPFVNSGSLAFDRMITVTASLYTLPTNPDPFAEIAASTPLYIDTLVLYDGSVYVPGTPKYPGIIGNTNNPGIRIDWSMIGKNTGVVDDTEVDDGEIPESGVGLYTFEDVIAGEYLLVISRPGYINRYAKINVVGDGALGHRELLPGDINNDRTVSVTDLSLLNANKSTLEDPSSYNVMYDLNGDGNVDHKDAEIILVLLRATFLMYTDSYDWLINY